eukprot:XP_014059759.1 PREDICTED: inactive rhomboid protein 1-like isoform X4 [Salmo salar]
MNELGNPLHAWFVVCSRRVHFERINTVPVKGQRASRRGPRKHHSLSRTLLRGTADWFGVSKDGDATQKWQRKSLRHCSMRYGRLKPQAIRQMDLSSQDNISLTSTETPPPLYVPSSAHAFGMQKIVDPLARGRAFRMVEEVDGYSVPQTPITPGAASLCSFTSSRSGLNRLPRRRKRESVAKMSFRAAAALVKIQTIPTQYHYDQTLPLIDKVPSVKQHGLISCVESVSLRCSRTTLSSIGADTFIF